jgi:hypothetical protein
MGTCKPLYALIQKTNGVSMKVLDTIYKCVHGSISQHEKDPDNVSRDATVKLVEMYVQQYVVTDGRPTFV